MKNLLIVIRTPGLQKIICKSVKKICKHSTVFLTNSLSDASKYLLQKSIDMFFIEDFLENDHFQNVAGFYLLSRIREIPKYQFTPVFFFSNLEYATRNAYEQFHCYTCLEYPFEINHFEKNLKQALSFQTPRPDNVNLYLKNDGILHHIDGNSITYIECNRTGTHIHTTSNQTSSFSYQTCKQFLNMMDSSDFIQCGKGTIVNLNHVEYIDPANLIIQLSNNCGQIELGNNYKEAIFETLNIPIIKKHKHRKRLI